MTKTKTTSHGGSKSHRPRGMALATFAGSAKADPKQQYKDVPGEETEDSQDWPDYSKEAIQGESEAGTSKSKVRQVTNPSRLKEEQKHLPRKPLQYHNPPT